MSDVDFGPSFRPQGVDWNNSEQTVGTVNFADKNTHAIFYMDRRHNPAKSEQEGHPIYDNIAFVRIGNPGERLNVVIRPATQVDQRRFPIQWAQFQQNMEQRPSGTPVTILFPSNPAVVGMLEGCNVFTVEQLADLSANGIENIGMGCQTYVNQAQQYLKMSEKGVKHAEFQKKLDERDQKIAQLTSNVQELNSTVTKLLAQLKNGQLRQQDADYAGGMERPTFMPNASFDPQTAQIDAIGHQTRAVPKKVFPKPSMKPTRRPRVHLDD